MRFWNKILCITNSSEYHIIHITSWLWLNQTLLINENHFILIVVLLEILENQGFSIIIFMKGFTFNTGIEWEKNQSAIYINNEDRMTLQIIFTMKFNYHLLRFWDVSNHINICIAMLRGILNLWWSVCSIHMMSFCILSYPSLKNSLE